MTDVFNIGPDSPPGDLLRAAAAGCREYATGEILESTRDMYLAEADVYETAARIADGDLGRLSANIPAHLVSEALAAAVADPSCAGRASTGPPDELTMAKLLLKLAIDWPEGVSPDTLWRSQAPQTKEHYRAKARWLLEQMNK